MGQAAQLQRILDYVSTIDAAAYNAYNNLQRTLNAELDKAVMELWNGMAEADDELRGHLLYLLAGSSEEDGGNRFTRIVSNRLTGAILIVVGIALATAGSVVGTLASSLLAWLPRARAQAAPQAAVAPLDRERENGADRFLSDDPVASLWGHPTPKLRLAETQPQPPPVEGSCPPGPGSMPLPSGQ
jgi:hypothetical protein